MIKKILTKVTALMSAMLLTSACSASAEAVQTAPEKKQFAESYGVFLSLDNSDLSVFDKYEKIVIDAQYFEAEDIAELHDKGHTVYSYINIGSVENFRSYYEDYSNIFLGEYENWEDEQWVDVSESKWQAFIGGTVASELALKGVDGFFVDNCDVYYVNRRKEIFDGVTVILKKLMSYDKAVIINGGDTYVNDYYNKNNTVSDILTGINQETVFSGINFNSDSFFTAPKDDREYFSEYVEAYAEKGADIFLLEYTKDKKLIKKIAQYCKNHDFEYYVSDSIELD